MDNGPVLWCRDLRKRFKERLAVDGVGFEVAPGETYGLLGPNGAGKTTTISMVCGLLRRDGGEVTVAGASLDQDPGRVKAAIGYVPQDVALYPDLSGLENLRFWGRMYGLAGRELSRRVEATLLLVTVFALVGTGVGMLLGAVLGNAEQATSIGPPVGIALGMLGGCMWPLAIVPEPMRVVGHLFPQAWAMDAFIALIAKDAGLAGITRQLAVLAAFAAALLVLATWRLRKALVG
jgi:hypothetical protein